MKDSPSSEPMIEIVGVNKWFGDFQALSNINLTVKKGEVVVVLGPSGSGKSTLCRTINKLETIDSGEIYVDGESVNVQGKKLDQMRSNIGMVFQQFNLISHMTVGENVILGPVRSKGRGVKESKARARELLERVGLGGDLTFNKLPSQLSGGQQQRVAIARALAMDPKVMLFDEPTSALDPEMIKEVLDVMVDLDKDGMTMVVVTHEMGFARVAGDRIVFMEDGLIVEEAEPAQFFDNPQSESAKRFLSKVISY